MKEEFLQYIWANALYRNPEFVTCSGKKIQILNPGLQNRDAGPDFFYARIKIGEVELVGNVEIHLSSSDWIRHNHHKDAAYDNVILSVVKNADTPIYTTSGQEIETIVLEYADHLYAEYLYMQKSNSQPGCRKNLKNLDQTKFNIILQYLAIERLERKCEDIRKILQQTNNDWEECFYRLLCKYWAGNVNSEPFYQLSLHIPYKLFLKNADKPIVLEALLLGGAGLLPEIPNDAYSTALKIEFQYLQVKHKLVSLAPEQWKFMRTRPDAFPTVRLVLLAAFLKNFHHLISDLLDAENLNTALKLMDTTASSYWDTHYIFGKESPTKTKKIGEGMKKITLINTLIPFMFMYGKELGEEKYQDKALTWLEELKAESNYITQSWEDGGFSINTALQSQALIQLRKEYCDQHKCLQCRIGREVLASVIL